MYNCKGIQEGFRVDDEKTFYSNYTSRVSLKFIKNLPNIFFPSLFQKEVLKEFEVRVFIFGTALFSMAIFSQLDKRSKVDFRNQKEDGDLNMSLSITERACQ